MPSPPVKRDPEAPNGLPTKPPVHSSTAADSGRTQTSPGTQEHSRVETGPIPKPDTPQDRFRAMLGFGQERTNSAQSGGSTGLPAASNNYHRPGAANSGPVAMLSSHPYSLSRLGGPTVPVSSNISARPGLAYNSPMQMLSLWCQSHGFNPQWMEIKNSDGTFTYHVLVGERFFLHNEKFPDPRSAKIATAHKAMMEILGKNLHISPQKRRDVSGSVEEISARLKQQEDETTSGLLNTHEGGATVGQGLKSGHDQDDRENRDRKLGMGRLVQAFERGMGHVQKREIQRELQRETDLAGMLAQVERGDAMRTLLPDHLRGNPLATRAFLEGVALGASLVEPTSSGKRPRSPSPPRYTTDRGGMSKRRRISPDYYRPDHSYNHQNISPRPEDGSLAPANRRWRELYPELYRPFGA